MGDTRLDEKTLDDILFSAGIDPEETWRLILWNDDVNSFEWVIVCLIKFLQFSPEKAEQSAYTVHLQGKDIIKTGTKESLEPYKKILEECGLTLTIEQ